MHFRRTGISWHDIPSGLGMTARICLPSMSWSIRGRGRGRLEGTWYGHMVRQQHCTKDQACAVNMGRHERHQDGHY